MERANFNAKRCDRLGLPCRVHSPHALPLGDKPAAFAAFDQAIALCSQHTADNLYRRGMAYFGRGDYQLAQQTFAAGLEVQTESSSPFTLFNSTLPQIDPNDSDAWFDRGECFRNLGQLNEALGCYKKVRESCLVLLDLTDDLTYIASLRLSIYAPTTKRP